MEPIDELVTEPNVEVVEQTSVENKEIVTDGVTPVQDIGDGYVQYKNALYQKEALKSLRPDLFSAKADTSYQSHTNFGTSFPKIATKGDIFVRVDVLPNRVFKFDGRKWIEVSKDKTDSYLYDQNYIQHLVNKLDKGEMDPDLLTAAEEEQIRNYLNGNQNT